MLGSARQRVKAFTMEGVSKPTNNSEQGEPAMQPRRSEAFGKNILGVSYIAPDFYEDLPLEFLLGEDDPYPCGGKVGCGG